jgi:hypothetical protein
LQTYYQGKKNIVFNLKTAQASGFHFQVFIIAGLFRKGNENPAEKLRYYGLVLLLVMAGYKASAKHNRFF